MADLGCGAGATLDGLDFARVRVGVDLGGAQLEWTRERGVRRLVRGSLTSLPLADGCLDTALALDVLEHVADDRRALEEIRRVLRPGGRAVLSVPAYPWLWSPHDERLGHHRRYRKDGLEERCREAGLDVLGSCHAYATVLPAAVTLRLIRRALGRLLPGRPASDDLYALPGPVNGAAYRLSRWEVALVRRGLLPAGLSVVAVVTPDARPRGAGPVRLRSP